MKTFDGRVAVVTGAASGIGFELSKRCAAEGMHVVMGDVDISSLHIAQKSIADSGGSALAVRTDVSKAEDVEALASAAMDAFGAVHLLFNNAGVAAGRTAWECSLEDWQWVMGVNLWGVIHGIRTFVPIMIKQDVECHVVNTASIEGLWTRSNAAPYQVTKHGVVCLSEVLHHDLKIAGAKIGVSILCPGPVATEFIQSERNRPESLINVKTDEPKLDAQEKVQAEWLRQVWKAGLSPVDCVEQTFAAIRENSLYILTHPKLNTYVSERMTNIVNGINPDINKLPLSNRAAYHRLIR